MEQELLRSIIQTTWNISCIKIEKITDTAWDIDGQFVLKKYNDEKELQRNIILMEFLLKKQIPTGEIIVSAAGSKYVEVNHTYLLLTRKLKGKNVLSIKECPGMARQMGKVIGNLHSALAVCDAELEVWDNSLLEEMQGWVYESLNKHNWKFISETDFNDTLVHLEEVYDKLPRQMIHRDVHFGNFLFDEGEFSGYIDFDLSQRNIRIFDICYFCLGLLVEEENKMSQKEWLQVVRDTIEGYREVAEVTKEERKAVPYVMQSIEILFIAFFLNEGDEAGAMDTKNIYKMLQQVNVVSHLS